MEDLRMDELFEKFKKEVLTNVESEEAKNAIIEAFIISMSKS